MNTLSDDTPGDDPNLEDFEGFGVDDAEGGDGADIDGTAEDKGAEEELVETDHRDASAPLVPPEDQSAVETAEGDPQEALEELGEDVASSPARRGTEDVENE